ncbi:MAG TPA: hypothetical protein VM324_14655 [Egibacteraceae bacterium]|nr:hypothetical protein [Egibacteraceae bacterium]
MLRLVGAHLGKLAGADLAARCALGKGGGGGRVAKHAGRAERKKALTVLASSRWAGTITRVSADQWERGWSNLWDERAQLRAAVATIRRRLDAPIGENNSKARGYGSAQQRWAKQQRLQHQRARLADVEERLEQGRVSVVRGSVRLARTRHNLRDAGLTERQWRDRWDAVRLFLSADGEADKEWGNETIRVHPDHGWVEVRLPTPLAHLSNTTGKAVTYRLDATATFTHRRDEWAAQTVDGPVAYTIICNQDNGRWYVDAAWTAPRPHIERDLATLRTRPTVGVDMNDGHLACWLLDASGNPVGSAHTIALHLDGDTARRDGQLRAAISNLLDYATRHGAHSVTIENLNFADARATGRETMGRGRRGKRFRRAVAGIPTARFRDRLVGMAANLGVAVIAVDPAYTSRWGGQHWQKPLNNLHRGGTDGVSRHHAAAVVIARRGLGHHARRGTAKPDIHQRMDVGPRPSRPDMTAAPPRNLGSCDGGPRQHQLGNTDPPDQTRPGNQTTQHRSGPSTEQDSLLLSV